MKRVCFISAETVMNSRLHRRALFEEAAQVRKLTDQEKEVLKTKIANERSEKHKKQQRLLAVKRQYKTYGGPSGGVGGAFRMGGSGGGQSYTSQLRAAKREKAFEHVFDKDEPLRPMKLSEAQKEALKKKIAEHKADTTRR